MLNSYTFLTAGSWPVRHLSDLLCRRKTIGEENCDSPLVSATDGVGKYEQKQGLAGSGGPSQIAAGPGGAVVQSGSPFITEALFPFVDGAYAEAHGDGGIGGMLAASETFDRINSLAAVQRRSPTRKDHCRHDPGIPVPSGCYSGVVHSTDRLAAGPP